MKIGNAEFTSFDIFEEWVKGDGKCWAYENTSSIPKEYHTCISNLYEAGETLYGRPTDNSRKVAELQSCYEYSAAYGIPFDVLYADNTYCIISMSAKKYIIPTQFLSIELWENYDDRSLAEIRGITGAGTDMELIPLDSSISIKKINNSIQEEESRIENLEKEIKALENKKREELKKLEEELQARYREREAELQMKMNDLHDAMKQLNDKMFILKTEIYGIRCLLGETVKFTALRTGSHASPEEPVVLFQKLRYLDEEMGRLVSLYDFDGDDIRLFEKFLQSCDYALEHFTPSEKCISLVRISRSGTTFAPSPKTANILKEYELYHGEQVGILIRNGASLYMGWTDEEHINIEDENLFYRPNKKEYEILDEKIAKKTKQTSKYEIASRYFIFSILQGILNDGHMMKIPEPVNLLKAANSRYVIFSMADAALEDNRYGLFSDIMDRCNVNTQQDDYILCVQRLTAMQPQNYRSYSNDRGRGEKNRTHDVTSKDNTIYTINLVEKEERIVTEYESNGHHYTVDGPALSHRFTEGVTNIQERRCLEKHYFISLRKIWSYSGATANFELYEDEFVNLTFLNSVWILYAIQNKKVGRWRIGGQEITYAYSLRYLNKILEYLRKREEDEAALIVKYTKLPSEWQVALSEWKLEHNVHNITEYQAKRFAKWLSVQSEGTIV